MGERLIILDGEMVDNIKVGEYIKIGSSRQKILILFHSTITLVFCQKF